MHIIIFQIQIKIHIQNKKESKRQKCIGDVSYAVYVDNEPTPGFVAAHGGFTSTLALSFQFLRMC